MIICETVGGLNNRLRCLISCMRIDNDIKLIWTVKETSVWLWCSFEDLFTNDFEIFDNKNICLEKYPNLPIYSAYKFIKLDNDDMDISHLDFDNWGDTITENIKTSVLNQINKLEPVKYIKNVVEDFKSKFNDDTVTVSIRTWKDAERNDASNGRFFDINKIFEEMDKDNYKNKHFFVTCDHQETFEEIYKRYKDRILYTPKRTFFGDYKTVEGIQDSIIDLLVGGQNKHMISSKGSSFCDMQWWFGGGKSTIKVINTIPGK